MIDLHVHTALCRHAEGSARAYYDAARARGLSIMAFTDHLPLLDTDASDYAMARSEVGMYVDAVRGLQGGIGPEVLLGIEADWLAGRLSETRELLAEHDYDIVLGSVHFIDDWAFDDPRLRERYLDWDIDELWARYFCEVADAAESGLFDVMAHLDLIKKFGIKPDREPVEVYEETAARISAAGVAVEISTGGLRKPVAEIYPSRALLARLFDVDVPVTIGSDAHKPSEVGYAYQEAAALARDVGYTSAVVFRDRVMQEVPL